MNYWIINELLNNKWILNEWIYIANIITIIIYLTIIIKPLFFLFIFFNLFIFDLLDLLLLQALISLSTYFFRNYVSLIYLFIYLFIYLYIFFIFFLYREEVGKLFCNFVIRVHQMFASKGTFSPRLFRFLGIDFEKVQSEEVKQFSSEWRIDFFLFYVFLSFILFGYHHLLSTFPLFYFTTLHLSLVSRHHSAILQTLHDLFHYLFLPFLHWSITGNRISFSPFILC